LDFRAGANLCSGGGCPRQLGNVHRLLGVECASVWAAAATTDRIGVTRDRPVRGTDRFSSDPAQLRVTPGGRRVEWGHAQIALECFELGFQIGRPIDPMVFAPSM